MENNKVNKVISICIVMWVLMPLMLILGDYNEAEEFESGTVIDNMPNRYASISSSNPADHNMTATIYDTNEYSKGGDGVNLTSEGIDLNNWQANTSKFLQIDVTINALEGDVHAIKIELPKELYVVGSVTEIPGGYSEVNFTMNDDITYNGDVGTYNINDHSGTLIYYLKPEMESGSIQLELRYDSTLWDKQDNSPITTSDVIPIDISMFHKDDVGVELATARVNKITSGSGLGLNGVVNFTRLNDYNDKAYTSEYIGYKDDKAGMSFNTYTLASCDSNYFYFKEEIIEMNLPYYEDEDGKKYYLKYDLNECGLYNYYNDTEPKYEILDNSATKLRIKITNSIFTRSCKLYMTLSYPDSLVTSEQKVIFKNGSVSLTLLGNNNIESNITLNVGRIGNITYYTEKVSDVQKLSDYTYKRNYMVVDRPQDVVSQLSSFYIRNAAPGDSTARKIEMKFDKGVLITSANLPMDTKTSDVDITYTLVDNEGNPVYLDESGNKVDGPGTGIRDKWTYSLKNTCCGIYFKDNQSVAFMRSMLPSSQRNYYFGSITYTMASIDGLIKLYDANRIRAYDGAGNIYGRLVDNITVGTELKNTITVSDVEGSDEPLVFDNILTVSKDCVSEVSMSKAKFSDDEIRAGESVSVESGVYIEYYPNDCSWLSRISIGVILPKGATLNEDSVIAWYDNNNKRVSIEEIRTKDIDNSGKMWIIDIDSSAVIGYSTEDYKSISTGYKINFSMEINTSEDVDSFSLFSDKIFRVAGRTIECERGYDDTWDLDGDGDTTDKIAGVEEYNKACCNVIPKVPSLDITDSISVNGESGSNLKTGKINARSDIVTYNLNIKCADDASASSFDYYIPIPKVDSGRDSYLVGGYKEDAYNFELLEGAKLSGNDIYSFEYTTEPNVVYKDVRGLAEDKWYTEAEMTSNGIKWSDVTMIKLAVSSGTIGGGMNSTITVNMKFADDNKTPKIGLRNVWKSSGYYDYDTGTKVISGHFRSKGCIAILNFTEEAQLTPEPTPTPSDGDTERILIIRRDSFSMN